MADEPENVTQEPPPGMLPGGKLNVVKKGSPRSAPVVIDDDGNEVDPEADADGDDDVAEMASDPEFNRLLEEAGFSGVDEEDEN